MEGVRFILIRHGETDANRRQCYAESDDIPLNEKGLRQAAEIAPILAARFQPQILISSQFRRARQTAGIIGDALGLAVEAVAGLHERNFGSLRGKPWGSWSLAGAEVPWLWKPEGGESLEEVRVRTIEALEMLRVRYAGQRVAIVCHGAVMRAICANFTGDWSEGSVPPNCGIVTIDYEEDGWRQPVKYGDWYGGTRES